MNTKQPLKEKRTQLELFFEALYKADPEDVGMYHTLFNPFAHAHFRSIEALTADIVHQQLKGTRFYEENRPDINNIVAMATAATIDTLEHIYRKNREASQRRKELKRFDELRKPTGKGKREA